MSFTPVASSPAKMSKILAEESARWRGVIDAVGIKEQR
jgi:hypothetical protein